MRFAVTIVIACAGCKGLLGLEDGVIVGDDGGGVVDASVEDATDAIPEGCYGVDPYVVCPGMSDGVGLIPSAIDTSEPDECDFVDTTTGRDWCVLVRADLAVVSRLRVVGTRPLVLLARNDLTTGPLAMINASSQQGEPSGPNANPNGCASGDGEANTLTGGGGAGGTFGTIGGDGGKGSPNFLVDGGEPSLVVTSSSLRGGCGGGAGAPMSATNEGGAGGGAIYLLAGGVLRIEGTVNASGAGGGGGASPGTGGGGGGAGGMILLVAPNVLISSGAQVFANGGGGGSGAGNTTNGGPGASSTSPSDGGSGSTVGTGGHGGRGATAISSGDDGNDNMAGGGGGGGGTGILRVRAATQMIAGAVSPPPT